MTKFFNEQEWDTIIQVPDWYMQLWPRIEKLQANKQTGNEAKKEIRLYFENRLKNNKICLGQKGENLDAERKPVDTVIIHHTSNTESYSLDKLDAVHLLNLYVPYYFDPYLPQDKYLQGTPIWSNHFNNGKQVFYAYHWMVRMDGSAERLLQDDQIGWQAGNWDINCRSVAICLDNDYSNSTPSKKVLKATANLISTHYSSVPKERIMGHSEVNSNTICPGNTFLSGWKADVLGMIKS